ncbi:MAG: diaminopimelate decarboxylase [Bacillota bacterium]
MVLPETMAVNALGELVIGGETAGDLARRFGTPLLVYDEELIRKRCREYMTALARSYPRFFVAFAGKAFMTQATAVIMAQEGLGLDLVSGGEIYTALKAGFSPDRIQFNGNNKSDHELSMAVKAGIGRVIADGFQELYALDEIARAHGVVQDILLRVTPGVEAHTHEYTQTGQEDSKFGFSVGDGSALEAVAQALSLPGLSLRGIHCHVGSQVLDLSPFRLAAAIMMDFRARIYQETGALLDEVNLGGGLGIRYQDCDAPPRIQDYVDAVSQAVREACRRHSLPLPVLQLEPGRSVVGEAGVTLYTVGTIKEIPGLRTYVSVDGGMTDNPRPALYGARYSAILAQRAKEDPARQYTIAGRCCESGDVLIWDIDLPEVTRGDILAVFSTGAYHYSMASNYNRCPKPTVVLVSQGMADPIVERETYEDLVAKDRIPARLRKGVEATGRACS